MENLKIINANLDINVGDVFYHKADGRKMVVIDFALDVLYQTKDKYRPECRFYDNENNRYSEQFFIFPELKKLNSDNS